VGDGYYVSASRDHTLCVWEALSSVNDTTSSKRVKHRLLGHHGPVNALDAYGDHHVVSASGDGTLKLWNIRTGECINTFKDGNDNGDDTDEPSHHQGLACVKCDQKRGLIYSGGQNGKLRIWDISSGQCLASLSGHHGLIRTMDLSEDGTILVTGSYDRTIRVWDLTKRYCRLSFQSGHSSWIFNLLVSRSRIISAGQDKQIMMLDFGKGLSLLDE
jgi:F-box and WD-40 domain protein 1/11